MAKYRKNLPQLETDQIFLGEGGMMTEFFFGEETKDIEVGEGNLFFHFIRDDKIMKWSEMYYRKFMDLCLKENNEFGYIMIAFWTYKATKANVQQHLNIEEEEWIKMNKDYVKCLDDIRLEYEKSIPNCPPILIQGLLIAKGGNGDAFSLDTKMNCEEAEEYHDGQIRVLAQETQVDFICIFLVSYSEEAIGVCKAAAKYEVPIVISYTTDINGRLKGGESIKESIQEIDNTTGEAKPAYYMINCSHATHFAHIFDDPDGNEYLKRIRGVKPNGSKKSHKELNNSTTLDTGDPEEFGRLLSDLHKKSGMNLNILSGCCGTDTRHLKETVKCLKKK